MGFSELLGNARLKENLENSINKGRISHFYLISGPVGSGKHTLARLLVAAILCGSENKPCLSCSACRKVMGNSHPDFITVEDPEHKTVPVRIVRQVREDMFIRPNEAQRKIYLFPQELGEEGQNALLKILEEPPSYGVYILLTDNSEKLLPTVRSRCTELKLLSLPEVELQQELTKRFPKAETAAIRGAITRSGGYLGQAIALLEDGGAVIPQTQAFVDSFTGKDAYGLIQVLVPMEKWKRDRILPVFTEWLQLLQSALACRSGMPAVSPLAQKMAESRSSADLLAAVKHLQKSIEYTQANVSVGTICGYLEWALR